MIRLYHVYKDYDRKSTALIDINLEIPPGEFVFLTGPSGAGKTTLLKLLFRAEIPTRGTIIVNGRNVVGIPESKVPALRRQLGIVFQDFKLLRHKTVFENISFIPKILGVPYWQRRSKTYEVLKQVGIADKMRRNLRKKGIKCKGIEGEKEGNWILMDYGDVVVHLFCEPVRAFYDIEGLWGRKDL